MLPLRLRSVHPCVHFEGRSLFFSSAQLSLLLLWVDACVHAQIGSGRTRRSRSVSGRTVLDCTVPNRGAITSSLRQENDIQESTREISEARRGLVITLGRNGSDSSDSSRMGVLERYGQP